MNKFREGIRNLCIFESMKKIFTLIAFALVVAASAQEEVSAPAADDVTYGAYQPVATEVAQAKNTDDDPLPAPKRPTYNFISYGLGISVWHNYEDSDKNPKLDWDQGIVFHYGRIWEMTTHGAITLINNLNISYESELQWHETFLVGGRYFFADKVFSPFVGMGLGVGLEMDYHFDKFKDAFALGPAAGIEGGLIIFRTSTTQLELGAAYDMLLDGFDFGKHFGSFSFYLAINY